MFPCLYLNTTTTTTTTNNNNNYDNNNSNNDQNKNNWWINGVKIYRFLRIIQSIRSYIVYIV